MDVAEEPAPSLPVACTAIRNDVPDQAVSLALSIPVVGRSTSLSVYTGVNFCRARCSEQCVKSELS